MKLHYQHHLKPLARTLRRAGNLSEVLLWNELRSGKLGYHFLRQRPIGRYVVDFFCHALRLVIEIDGAASHDNKTEKDEVRQKTIESLGLTVVRYKDAEVRYHLASVLESIKSEILRLAGSPPPLEKEELFSLS